MATSKHQNQQQQNWKSVNLDIRRNCYAIQTQHGKITLCKHTQFGDCLLQKKLEQKRKKIGAISASQRVTASIRQLRKRMMNIEWNKGDDCENAHIHNKKTKDNREIKSNTTRKIKCKICSRFDRITIVTILIEQSVVFNGCSE